MSERDTVAALLESAAQRGAFPPSAIEYSPEQITVTNGNPGCAVYFEFDADGCLVDVGTCPG